jgi:hypothetical protein
MLLVEWQYIRLYINSLALQAVAERESTQMVGVDSQSVRISDEDAIYIDHVVDASKSILNYMITEFAPRGYLRLSPVKVFLRIISAAVFLVKVGLFSLVLMAGACSRSRSSRSEYVFHVAGFNCSNSSEYFHRRHTSSEPVLGAIGICPQTYTDTLSSRPKWS